MMKPTCVVGHSYHPSVKHALWTVYGTDSERWRDYFRTARELGINIVCPEKTIKFETKEDADRFALDRNWDLISSKKLYALEDEKRWSDIQKEKERFGAELRELADVASKASVLQIEWARPILNRMRMVFSNLSAGGGGEGKAEEWWCGRWRDSGARETKRE